jgi:hypothetical protein
MDGRDLFRAAHGFTDCSVEDRKHAGAARDIITVADGKGGLHSIPWHCQFDIGWWNSSWVRKKVQVYVDGHLVPELEMHFEPVHKETPVAEEIAAHVITRGNGGSTTTDYRDGYETQTVLFEAASAVAAAKTDPSKKRGTCVFTASSTKVPDAKVLYSAIDRASEHFAADGSFEITFKCEYGELRARLFVWGLYDKVVTTDIDGTLTKSGKKPKSNTTAHCSARFTMQI